LCLLLLLGTHKNIRRMDVTANLFVILSIVHIVLLHLLVTAAIFGSKDVHCFGCRHADLDVKRNVVSLKSVNYTLDIFLCLTKVLSDSK